MTKKERVIAAIEGWEVDGVPSCFSLHFPETCAAGEAAVDAHLKFFKESDTDIVKVMNENVIPFRGNIRTPEEYRKIQAVGVTADFMQEQLALSKKILDRCDQDVFKIGTLHGALISCTHVLKQTGLDYDQARRLLCRLLREDEKPVLAGMKRICDGMCELAAEYMKIGMDGIYYACLGGEKKYFTDEEYARWIAPFDRQIMTAIRAAGGYCFLHICKDDLSMDRFADYWQYADVFNWGIGDAPFSLEEGRKMFCGKTVMGGLPNRSGVLADGSAADIKNEVRRVIENYGRKNFILGADCTLATEQNVARVRAAVEAARES